MTEVQLVNCGAPNYRLTLYLDHLPEMKIANLRCILRMAKTDPDNEDAISELQSFGASAEQGAKDAWKLASEDAVRGRKKVLANDRRPASVKQRALNRKLLTAVKKTKATYERWVKINQLITERK